MAVPDYQSVLKMPTSGTLNLNLGIFVFISFIKFFLLTVHISCGDDSEQTASLRKYQHKDTTPSLFRVHGI